MKMDPKPHLLTSLLIVLVSVFASGKHLPRQQQYEYDYYYMEDTLEEAMFPSFIQSFQPSTTRCCKVGESIAKKGMTCTASMHLNKMSDNWEEHASKLLGTKDEYDITVHVIELLMKSQVCLISDEYFGNFKKCCNYEKDYKTALKACQRFKSGAQRRACRDDVHWQYP